MNCFPRPRQPLSSRAVCVGEGRLLREWGARARQNEKALMFNKGCFSIYVHAQTCRHWFFSTLSPPRQANAWLGSIRLVCVSLCSRIITARRLHFCLIRVLLFPKRIPAPVPLLQMASRNWSRRRSCFMRHTRTAAHLLSLAKNCSSLPRTAATSVAPRPGLCEFMSVSKNSFHSST